MSSQAPLAGLQSYSNLRPGSSFIIGADPDHSENNASRQHQQHEFVQNPAGAPEMGLGIMTNLESTDDSRYGASPAWFMTYTIHACCLYVVCDVSSAPILNHIGEVLGSKIPFRAFLTQPISARLSTGAPKEPNSNGRLHYKQGQ